MMCMDCSWGRRCDGADCYYDHVKAMREEQDGYDEKVWHKVDLTIRCAYTRACSLREVDEYRETHPQDDMHVFMKAQDIAADDEIKWGSDEIWHQRGKEEARVIVSRHGLEEIYACWAGHARSDLTAQCELGFYDELMEMAVKAGLRKG